MLKKYAIIIIMLLAASTLRSQQLAFPTAEGFGRFATGGRGGTVYHVTNLNDTGTGSFRDAVSQPNRTVVFDVGGIIRITTRIIVSHHITIAGQTAPGDGICIYGNGLSFSNANHSIVRHIRIRMGINGDSGKDAIAIARGNNMIFDHVSVSWGRDGTFDINPDSGTEITDLTIQNCIIGQGLETHSTGGLMQTTGGISALRNLYIDNNTRNPKVKGINQFVNNVVYNWIVGAYILGDSEGPSAANVSNNYFINGPSTQSAAFTRGNLNFQIYASNNFQDTNRDGVLNGAVIPQSGYGTVAWRTTPFNYPTVTQMTPLAAYNYVRSNAGASLHRDQVDARLITELTSLGTLGQTIRNENTAPMSGPGTIAGGTAPADTDRDGMSNSWEAAHGFNANSASDANTDADGDGYTNLEEYLNELAGDTPPVSGSSITIQESTTGFCSVDGTIDSNHAGFTGTGFANAGNAVGSGINWRISAGSGSATISWRYANGSGSNRPGRLLVNGTVAVATINFPATTNWTTWNTASVNVNLSGGTHTLRLEATAATGLTNIDQITITGSNMQAVSCASGARQRTIEVSENEELQVSESEKWLEAFPNPSSGAFHIRVNGTFNYVIYDHLGRSVDKGIGIDEIEAGTQLKAGRYILKVKTSKDAGRMRLIKQ